MTVSFGPSQFLDVTSNPLNFPPPSVCSRGLHAIIDALSLQATEPRDASHSNHNPMDSPIQAQPLKFGTLLDFEQGA